MNFEKAGYYSLRCIKNLKKNDLKYKIVGVLLLLVGFFKIYLQYELECRLIFRGSWKGVVLCGKVYDSTLTKKEKKREQLRRSSD